jgi:hypothetical protein
VRLSGDLVNSDLRRSDWEHINVLVDALTHAPEWAVSRAPGQRGCFFVPWAASGPRWPAPIPSSIRSRRPPELSELRRTPPQHTGPAERLSRVGVSPFRLPSHYHSARRPARDAVWPLPGGLRICRSGHDQHDTLEPPRPGKHRVLRRRGSYQPVTSAENSQLGLCQVTSPGMTRPPPGARRLGR